MAAMKMKIEPASPFNALDVLVARDEGLFVEEGLEVEIAVLAPAERARTELPSQDRYASRGERDQAGGQD